MDCQLHKLATGTSPRRASVTAMPEERELTIKQTSTGYWVVRSGDAEIAGALTRKAAESERDLMRRLRTRTAEVRTSGPRRTHARPSLPPR